jgi:hypothetical protein
MADLANNAAKIDLNGDGNCGGGNEEDNVGEEVENDDYSSMTFDPERAQEEAQNAKDTANLERVLQLGPDMLLWMHLPSSRYVYEQRCESNSSFISGDSVL